MPWLKAEIVGGVVEEHLPSGEYRQVGTHQVKPKTSTKTYRLPRVTLPGEYAHLVGRRFKVYRAKLKVDGEGEGEALILFFP
ncbi:TPA: hypothetical protein EYP27_03015 [Candidatus Bathyarchaeota archaeon]|nr:hypothetical protein [Candidatus Bathyarchaeota archaeon]